MNELLSAAEQWWGLIVAIGGSVGAYFRWKATRKKSTDMLLDELEAIKQKMVESIRAQINHAEEIAASKMKAAEKEQQLKVLRAKLDQIQRDCPDCYQRALNQDR